MGLNKWIWKNKYNWNIFEIYKIDFTYFRFSKIFNSARKNLKQLEAIAGHISRMKIKEKIKKYTARFSRYCRVGHPGVPKVVKAQNCPFSPCFADHCDPIFHLVKNFHLLSFPSHVSCSRATSRSGPEHQSCTVERTTLQPGVYLQFTSYDNTGYRWLFCVSTGTCGSILFPFTHCLYSWLFFPSPMVLFCCFQPL